MSERRVGTILTVAVAMAVGLAGCGKGGGATAALGDDAIRAIDVAAQTDASRQPLDAAPSPDGTVIYYIVTGDDGAAILSVPAAGGPATTLASGPPLAKPTGVAVASDGSRLFVADREAGTGGTGGILTIPTTGAAATPALLAGTEGRSPRGLDVVNQAGGDVVFFTGLDPANGAMGLFQVPAAGGAVATVAEGAPFLSPDSVVASAKGPVYVTDQGVSTGHGQAFRVVDGKATAVLTGLTLGSPAGVTLGPGDTTLLVSSIDGATGANQVLFLEIDTGKTAAATKVIGANKNSSGGLHRAQNAAVLAWADVQRPGRIYRVEL